MCLRLEIIDYFDNLVNEVDIKFETIVSEYALTETELENLRRHSLAMIEAIEIFKEKILNGGKVLPNLDDLQNMCFILDRMDLPTNFFSGCIKYDYQLTSQECYSSLMGRLFLFDNGRHPCSAKLNELKWFYRKRNDFYLHWLQEAKHVKAKRAIKHIAFRNQFYFNCKCNDCAEKEICSCIELVFENMKEQKPVVINEEFVLKQLNFETSLFKFVPSWALYACKDFVNRLISTFEPESIFVPVHFLTPVRQGSTIQNRADCFGIVDDSTLPPNLTGVQLFIVNYDFDAFNFLTYSNCHSDKIAKISIQVWTNDKDTKNAVRMTSKILPRNLEHLEYLWGPPVDLNAYTNLTTLRYENVLFIEPGCFINLKHLNVFEIKTAEEVVLPQLETLKVHNIDTQWMVACPILKSAELRLSTDEVNFKHVETFAQLCPVVEEISLRCNFLCLCNFVPSKFAKLIKKLVLHIDRDHEYKQLFRLDMLNVFGNLAAFELDDITLNCALDTDNFFRDLPEKLKNIRIHTRTCLSISESACASIETLALYCPPTITHIEPSIALCNLNNLQDLDLYVENVAQAQLISSERLKRLNLFICEKRDANALNFEHTPNLELLRLVSYYGIQLKFSLPCLKYLELSTPLQIVDADIFKSLTNLIELDLGQPCESHLNFAKQTFLHTPKLALLKNICFKRPFEFDGLKNMYFLSGTTTRASRGSTLPTFTESDIVLSKYPSFENRLIVNK